MSIFCLVFLQLSLNEQGYGDLEQACTQFIWGKNVVRDNKKTLMAWKKITKQNAKGGLDICHKALKIWCIFQFLIDQDIEWIEIAQKFIKVALKVGHDKKERKKSAFPVPLQLTRL